MSMTSSYFNVLPRSVANEQDFGMEHSLKYIIALVALGLFASLMTLALNPAWLDAVGW
ncbi:MAG: hypothetical protein NVSMB26_14250 [Beijerinckiaceae bacterium]